MQLPLMLLITPCAFSALTCQNVMTWRDQAFFFHININWKSLELSSILYESSVLSEQTFRLNTSTYSTWTSWCPHIICHWMLVLNKQVIRQHKIERFGCWGWKIVNIHQISVKLGLNNHKYNPTWFIYAVYFVQLMIELRRVLVLSISPTCHKRIYSNVTIKNIAYNFLQLLRLISPNQFTFKTLHTVSIDCTIYVKKEKRSCLKCYLKRIFSLLLPA